MSKPFFIWTMRRTGGTSLTDLLMSLSEYKTVQHEPFNFDREFGNNAKRIENEKNDNNIRIILKEIFKDKPLIKHCYEISSSKLNRALIKFLKDTEYKHIFLMRKDEKSRIFSLLLAYQTNIWGKVGSKKIYEKIKKGEIKLSSFKFEEIKFEVERAMNSTREVFDLLNEYDIPFKVVYFEDLYQGSFEKKYSKLIELLKYLEFNDNQIEKNKSLIKDIILNRSQNTNSILEYVPNIKEASEYIDKLVTSYQYYFLDMKKFNNKNIGIRLYLGAHKTATTYIQGVLEKNQEILYKKKYLVSIPKNQRNTYLPLFFKYLKNKDPNLKIQLQNFVGFNIDQWIFSDENFIGIPIDFYFSKEIYPYFKDRLKVFKEIYSNNEIKLFFTIRNYKDFYNSIYSEILRNKFYISKEEFKQDFLKENSWVTLIEDLVNILDKENIFIFEFEWLKTNMNKFLSYLCSISVEEAEEFLKSYGNKKINIALCQDTIDTIDAVSCAFNKNELPKVIKRLNECVIKKGNCEKVNIFSQEEEKFFNKKYQKDLERLSLILKDNLKRNR